eukprot:CAMPEP_0119132474 /NCGR_PEP_ID=MMETSP1310-20130426/11855_1 /TAXON_ID=464262 /ORGANISM="Genus nov. species nov., Strain RCC2339" /LENGTH=249 /DNA_ID=CAMNT_0007123111 /DNA_START=62 /DNA_END=811 /DNA_ORIENTATION=+
MATLGVAEEEKARAKSPRMERLPQPPPLPAKALEQLKGAFSSIDSNGDGRVDVGELHIALKKAGFHFPKRVIRRMLNYHLHQADELSNVEKGINFDQFASLSAFLEMMKKTFKTLDGDGNGCIDDKELGSGLIDLGLPIKGRDIRLLMAIVDADNNGTVEFEEFVDLAFYLIYFRLIAQTFSSTKVENLAPADLQDACSCAGVDITLEKATTFIDNHKGRPLSFQDMMGVFLIAQKDEIRAKHATEQSI